MYSSEIIENLLQQELKGLCMSCINAPTCSYRLATDKTVIQCEMFETGNRFVQQTNYTQPGGLCMNCAKATICQLPDRYVGVWHCGEYI
jgi:hypothetical protein